MVLFAIDIMKNAGLKNHINAFSAALSAVYCIWSYVTDKTVFELGDGILSLSPLALFDYVICKAIAFAALFFFVRFVLRAVEQRKDKESVYAGVAKYALYYLPIVVIVLAVKLPGGFTTNDEYAIAENARRIVHDTWFNYMTIYYYIASFMIVPFKYGPVIIKAVIQLLTVGYVTFRSVRYFGKKAGLFMYILFLLYPVIAYIISAHRLPVYFLLYLCLFSKLSFDLAEGADIGKGQLFVLLLAGAVLTQWRTEGIYLLVLVPILILIVYPKFRKTKSAVLMILAYVLLQYTISVPQNITSEAGLANAANDRMKPFYAYTITNMYRNGLDLTKNEADLAVVDAYIPLEAISDINEYYGDINYEDVFILYKEEFSGVRKDATYTQYYDFTKAVKNIFINNPDVFARTRWGAFCYAALPYHFAPAGEGAARFVISAVKTVSYNLFIPVGFALLLLVYSLIKRKWFYFFAAAGLVAHWFIVLVLAPASYFKYYFPVYIMSYFYLITMIIGHFTKRDMPESIGGAV